jgi:hypothetical protein
VQPGACRGTLQVVPQAFRRRCLSRPRGWGRRNAEAFAGDDAGEAYGPRHRAGSPGFRTPRCLENLPRRLTRVARTVRHALSRGRGSAPLPHRPSPTTSLGRTRRFGRRTAKVCFCSVRPQKLPGRFRPDHAMRCELRRAVFRSASGGGPDLQAANLLQPSPPDASVSGAGQDQAFKANQPRVVVPTAS